MKPPASQLKYLSHRDELGKLLNGLGLTGTVVEVGTLYGAYSEVLLKTWRGRVACVDPWTNQDQAVYHDGANKENMENIFAHVQRTIGQNPRCQIIRALSLDGANQFRDGELAAVYLDGNHSLESVRRDIAAWFPKVKVGGIFCGHDYFTRYDNDTNSDAETAVNELAERIHQWPHVTWDTSWFFLKTQEVNDRYYGKHPEPKAAAGNGKVGLIPVLSVCHADIHLAKKWLRWASVLSQDLSAKRHQLVVFGSKALTADMWADLKRAADGIKPCPIFRATPEVFERGYAPSANYLFRTALELVEREFPGKAMLWCEADTVPMHATWVQEIEAEYQACGKPFLGDFFAHAPGVAGIDHMTGTAVYPPDWRELAPSLAMLPEPRPEQGWDTLCAHETVPQMARAKTIQQIWRPGQFRENTGFGGIRAETALFHQCKDGSLIDMLCAGKQIPRIPLDPPIPRYVQSAEVAPGAPSAGVEILICTFRRDIDFLRYTMASIEKYANGFSGVTIVIPKGEERYFKWAEAKAKVVAFDEPAGRGMLWHEIMICRADELCPDARYVLHMDSDTMFWKPTTPQDFLPGGRCLIVREKYSDIAPRNPNRLIWRECVRAATGIVPEWEFMTRHPNIYPREIYAHTRRIIEEHTGRSFNDYVLSCENGFPQGFCEFNTLSAVAIRDMPNRFRFVDYDHAKDGAECGLGEAQYQYAYRPERDHVVEAWSHAGIQRYKIDFEKFLSGNLPKYYIK